MDDSIFNSWTVESDILNGENVSYIGRDYTPEFTTDQIFKGRDEMLDWVRSVGRENGIVVVIKRSANLKDGKLPKCILACERGGKYEPPRYLSEGQTLQRNTGTKKCGCPFELRGVAIPPNGVMWGLRVKCGFHNHETAKYLDGHEYPSRLKPMEKQFVLDMAGSTKPREILNVLKERDSTNTTGIQSIYNAISTHKQVKRGGLNPIQHALDQLIIKKYLHAFRTNPETNEITDILWVHPKSLELFITFPTVLIIDATYKTNEYRIPLLEVVGITSTLQTYSLMFAYLANEKSERLTWALGTLKNLMITNGAVMPSVLVSDRDLALMKAIETCFPTARHILCVWHINQNVVKYCSPILGSEMKRFFASWQSLIMSSTPESYQQKWHILVGEFKSYPRATKYLWETWLRPYKERFVAAWINTFMHLGSNSSQRAESAHARLKIYLGDTMSSLDTSFAKIHKMLRIQFSGIQKSFERSINIPRHKQRTDYIFSAIVCQISIEALKFIDEQLEYANTASPFIAGYCDCTIKATHGLPCMHDLANYRSLGIPIPLSDINSHWTRLCMQTDRSNDDQPQSDKTPELSQGMNPSHSTVRSPAYNTEHRGRPAGKDEQSRRRKPSIVESYSSGSKGASNSTLSVANSRVRKNQPPATPIFDPFIQELPKAYQDFISYTIDVQADGHCGFRAIAAQVGYGEDNWAQVRMDLIQEIQTNMELYNVLYPEYNYVNTLLHSLAWFAPTAPQAYWMDSMALGVVIASRYNLVLHTLDTYHSGCFTHLSLRSPPVPVNERQEIAIARIRGNHFIQVFLRHHYPVPPIPLWWWQHVSIEARGWAESYIVRMNLWSEIMGGGPGAPGGEFGGDID